MASTTSQVKPTFEVDKQGLGKLLARRGKEFSVVELVQNAWDEDTTRVDVTLEPLDEGKYRLVVEDDNPEGFSDLAHAYTLFAESNKKGKADKRGRFNLGEKLVIAICDTASIATTKGTIIFDEKGRHHVTQKRKRGSVFTGTLTMTEDEAKALEAMIFTLLPPHGITTTFNHTTVPERKPLTEFTATLRTELGDEEGRLRPTTRKTSVQVYEPLPGETPSIYEMGIPVVETGDRYHLDVGQKIPLNLDRDNVPPGYLRDLRAYVLNATAALLTAEDSKASWVTNAIEDEKAAPEAVAAVVRGRFGEKAVIHDMNDTEANKIAVEQGFTVVPGGALPKAAWANVKSSGILEPAGKVTPSPNPNENDENLKVLDPTVYTKGQRNIVGFAKQFALSLMTADIDVRIVSDNKWPFLATYGPRSGGTSGLLTLNVGKLGFKWFDSGVTDDVIDLLIHEFGHHYGSDHLDRKYLNALTTLGAKAVRIALDEPQVFTMDYAELLAA